MSSARKILFILISLIITGCATKHSHASADNEAQTTFGIFLTVNTDHDLPPETIDLARVQLAPSPVISANDVISYNFSNHSMKLRSDPWPRIGKVPVHGLPFVVVADGKRIYWGAFWSLASSIPSQVPTITSRFNQPADIITINAAYPTDSFAKGPDPRGDPRIKNALAALHKSK